MIEIHEIARFTAAAALAATLLMLVPGVALAWVLARRRFPGKAVVEALVSLPLVVLDAGRVVASGPAADVLK